MQTHNAATILYELQQILIQIKNSGELPIAEYQKLTNDLSAHGLSMLNYALFALESQQQKLLYTSVSASAALYEVTQEVQPLASSYGIKVGFSASANLEPVYTHEQSLKGSIYGLLAGVITSSSPKEANNLTVTVQQTKPFTQRIGVYADGDLLSTKLVKPQHTKRVMRMSHPSISHTSGLGFTISQLLAERMQANFEPFVHKSKRGIGFYMPESQQLSLV